MPNKIKIFSSRASYRRDERGIRVTAEKIFRFLKKSNLELEVYLVDGQQMRFLNKKFLGKEGATNVLSFEEVAWPHFDEAVLRDRKRFREIGEVYLCPTYILKTRSSLGRMLIHGILHLFHYKHREKSDTIKMEKLEKRLCRVAGVPYI